MIPIGIIAVMVNYPWTIPIFIGVVVLIIWAVKSWRDSRAPKQTKVDSSNSAYGTQPGLEAERQRQAEAARQRQEAERRRMAERYRPWSGIEGVSVSASLALQLGLVMNHGVYVVRVRADSPAAEARLLGGGTDASGKPLSGGDLIVAVDGKSLSNIAELDSVFLSRRIGETVSLTLRRNHPGYSNSLVAAALIDERTVSLRLARKPEGASIQPYLPSAATIAAQSSARKELLRQNESENSGQKETQRLEAPPSIISEKEMLEFLLNLSGYQAWCCGFANRRADGTVVRETSHFHLDHLDPKSKGGSNQITNRAPMCAKHNLRKSDRRVHLEDYRAEIAARGELMVSKISDLVDLPWAYQRALDYYAKVQAEVGPKDTTGIRQYRGSQRTPKSGGRTRSHRSAR